MTDKTEAQPEALRVAAWLINAPFKTTHGDMLVGGRELRRLYAETEAKAARIAELEAQLSARQAAPVLVVTEDMHVAAVKVLHRASGVHGLPQRMLDAMLSAAPSQPEREPLSHEAARKLVWSASTWSRSEGVSEDDVLEVIAAVERAQGIGATND